MKRQNHESKEQQDLIRWCRGIGNIQFPGIERIFSIPNEGKRTKYMAVKMKREGLAPGVPDLFLPIINSVYGGLWIEMKYGKNKPTKTQHDWLTYFIMAGYMAVVCYSCEDAISAIKLYMNIR